ncbi:MAG: ribosome maturation factor RimM [Rhodanobacteraceae bacterium]|nr:ribosome maturation factor RimM [Xanthomonadales bacterium]MCP5478815.1 ribosome maturation factor RimM [Rhodanobacteraceae bacterium]HPF73419.1 ribosome maturation factor RimM [Xanthomonadaceae bacterium]HRX99814.1 ribosome maturation factor RimM [Xanthomonadaceae bacterium]
MAADKPASIELGRIAGVFGVRGWLKIESWTDPREAIFDYPEWHLSRQGSDAATLVRHLEGRPQGKGLVVRLPGIDTQEAARELIGQRISILREDLPEPAPGEFYWADLEGLSVSTVDGVALGRVSHLIATGANDVLVVQGERERLIPFVQPDVVRDVDLQAGTLTVDWDADF